MQQIRGINENKRTRFMYKWKENKKTVFTENFSTLFSNFLITGFQTVMTRLLRVYVNLSISLHKKENVLRSKAIKLLKSLHHNRIGGTRIVRLPKLISIHF